MKLKKLFTLFTACALSIMTATFPSFADTVDASQTTLTEYVKNMYPENVIEPGEQDAFNIFYRVETGDFSMSNLPVWMTSSKWNYVYAGTEQEVYYYYDLMGYEYGFADLKGSIGSVGGQPVMGYIANIDDFSQFKAEYIRVAEKAKEVAKTLKGANDLETLENIYSYVAENANIDSGESDGYLGRTGFFDGKKIRCSGFASAVAQLCRFNGIRCTVVSGTYKGRAHAWNRVIIGENTYYVDAALKNGISTNLPWGYVLNDLSSGTSIPSSDAK